MYSCDFFVSLRGHTKRTQKRITYLAHHPRAPRLDRNLRHHRRERGDHVALDALDARDDEFARSHLLVLAREALHAVFPNRVLDHHPWLKAPRQRRVIRAVLDLTLGLGVLADQRPRPALDVLELRAEALALDQLREGLGAVGGLERVAILEQRDFGEALVDAVDHDEVGPHGLGDARAILSVCVHGC